MSLKHKVQINVTDKQGQKQSILKSGVRHLPRRLLHWLFGDNAEVLVLSKGQSVESVEIHEVVKGEDSNESNRKARKSR